jgi:hypothetical protein
VPCGSRTDRSRRRCLDGGRIARAETKQSGGLTSAADDTQDISYEIMIERVAP